MSEQQGRGPGEGTSGTSRAGQGRAEERRVVTTLICDIVGFTALSERNDPEVVDAALRRYYAAARRVVEAYGGTVEKFIGDAVVAVFGVPVAHEDDPERAVRAGLRLVDEVDALPAVGGRQLEVRVGVNTGEALVRLDVDPASGEGFLTGDAVNVAARLQAATPPGGVAVGEATHGATEKVFAFDACHPVTLKGKSEPLRAWLATAPLARTGAELRSFTTRFVGREDELATLEGLLDGAASARAPRLGLIVGEPGIGKSRLLAELSGRLDDQPSFVVWRQGRCLPFGSGVTFWALSEIVKACAGILESDGVARTEARLETVLPGDDDERERVRARLRPLLGLEAEEASRNENFAVWRTFLEGLATKGPAVIVVEDLHWADEGMLAFMDFLAAGTAPVPLVVLATARPEVLDLTGAGAGFVAAAERITLGPLSGDETAELVLACLGAKALPVALQARLLEASGGNPLFAEELVRLLQDRDLLTTRGGQTQLKEGAELPTPDSIGALIAARLDLLTPERKALLADAAVVGRTFWAGAVAAVGSHDPAQVFEGLHELVAKELVRPERSSAMEGETEFVFVHALVRDVAYAQLTRADRATKHAALARWLEGRTAGRTEDLAEILAFHYGTALEMANACGLFDLEDELAEPTTRYLELAGGRAAPLDAAAAAAHFARAERVADEAAKPKRRFFLSRRARRTLRRRAPLLAAATVIAVAAVAAVAIWAFASKTPAPITIVQAAPSPTPTTPAQMEAAYGPSVVRITGRVPYAVGHRLAWKKVVASGFVADEYGTIFTSNALVNSTWGERYWRGKDYRYVAPYFGPRWLTVEFFGTEGQYTRVPGYNYGNNPDWGVTLIGVDPKAVHLAPIPLGDSNALRRGKTVTALCRANMQIGKSTGEVVQVAREQQSGTGEKVVSSLRVDADLPEYLGPDQIRPVLPYLGGPIIDGTGRVVAVVGPHTWPPVHGLQGKGSACAIENYRLTVDYYSKATQQRSAYLAFQECDVTFDPGLAKKYDLPVKRGLIVQLVDPGGAADRAGIRGGTRVEDVNWTYAGVGGTTQVILGGDIIVALDGTPTPSWSHVGKILDRHKPGDTIMVKLYRGHRLMTMPLTLDPLPWQAPKLSGGSGGA